MGAAVRGAPMPRGHARPGWTGPCRLRRRRPRSGWRRSRRPRGSRRGTAWGHCGLRSVGGRDAGHPAHVPVRTPLDRAGEEQRLAVRDRTGGCRADLGVQVGVGDDHRSRQVVAGALDGVAVELDEQVARLHLLAARDRERKCSPPSLTVSMPMWMSSSAPSAWRSPIAWPVGRRRPPSRRTARTRRPSAAGWPRPGRASRRRTRHRRTSLSGDDGAVERAQHLDVGALGGDRRVVLGLLEADEHRQQERQDDRHGQADREQDHVAVAEQGGQREARRDDECGRVHAADGDDRAADRAADDAEGERPLERQVDAVDRGLGDAGEEAGERRGGGERLEVLVAGAHPDPGHGAPPVRGQRRTPGAMSRIWPVVWNSRVNSGTRPQCRPKITKTCQRPPMIAPAEPRRGGEDPADAAAEPAADDRRHRADDEEDERHGDEHDDHRGHEAADRAGQLRVEEALRVALQPDDDDDRDDAGDVADHRERDAEERQVGRADQRRDGRVEQRGRDRERRELVRLEVTGGGERQCERQEVDERVGQRVEDDIGRRRRVDPAERHRRGEERLQQTGAGERPEERGEDRRDHRDEAVEEVALRAVRRRRLVGRRRSFEILPISA